MRFTDEVRFSTATIVIILVVLTNNSSKAQKSNYLKDLISLKQHSLWKFVKDEPLFDMNPSYKSIEEFVDYSIENVPQAVKFGNAYIEAMHIMDLRTNRYAFLIIVYGFERMKIKDNRSYVWVQMKQTLRILGTGQTMLGRGGYIAIYLDELASLKRYGEVLNKLHSIIVQYFTYFLTPEQLEDAEICNFSAQKTDRIPQKVMDLIFKDFPKPHNGHEPYDFHMVPSNIDDFETKINKIVKLVRTEYDSFLKTPAMN